MPAADEIARPGGQVLVRLVAILGAQDVADEPGERFLVAGGGVTKHEAVTELADHGVSSRREIAA
jgi:hypothetical protein